MRCQKWLCCPINIDDHTRSWKIWSAALRSDYAENAAEETLRPLQLPWSMPTPTVWSSPRSCPPCSTWVEGALFVNQPSLINPFQCDQWPSLRSGHLCCIGNWILFTDRCYARLDSSPVVSSEALLQAWKSIQRLKNPVKARIVIEKDMFLINNLISQGSSLSDLIHWYEPVRKCALERCKGLLWRGLIDSCHIRWDRAMTSYAGIPYWLISGACYVSLSWVIADSMHTVCCHLVDSTSKYWNNISRVC